MESSWENIHITLAQLFSHDCDLIDRVQQTKPSTLYMACVFGVIEMVELLLNFGVCVDDLYRTYDGLSYWSCLITIISSGYLLSVSTSQLIRDLLCKVDWSKYEEIISLLVEEGLDINGLHLNYTISMCFPIYIGEILRD